MTGREFVDGLLCVVLFAGALAGIYVLGALIIAGN